MTLRSVVKLEALWIVMCRSRLRVQVSGFTWGRPSQLPAIRVNQHVGSRCLATKNSDMSGSSEAMRRDALNRQLESLGIDFDGLWNAVLQSVHQPSMGYNVTFGKSAVRTYKAFVNPRRPEIEDSSGLMLAAAAGRSARQIDFLIKHHKSREAEWVRHTDTATKRQTFPLTLLLDNVRSSFNVGSLFRTADACGVEEVITTGITPHPNGSGAEKLTKSALGADRLLRHRHFDTTFQAIHSLQESVEAIHLVGLETTSKSVRYTDYNWPKGTPVALILGNEVTGVDTEIMHELDGIVEIPMFGAKNSLNIAACAPVVLYEILRQWQVTTGTDTDRQ